MSEQMPPSNTGHGHVWPRPDGIKARCGGPAICRECARDAARNAAPAAPPAPTDYTGLILRLKREGSVTVSDRFDAADALTALLRERDALWACVEAAARIDAERELAEARAERDGARSQRDHVVKQLTRIHSFMTPENVRLPDGHVFEFNNPRIEHEMLHALSDAIRAVDLDDCPTWNSGYGQRCRCDLCTRCGYPKHTAVHGPALGQPPGSKPWGHEYVPLKQPTAALKDKP